MAKASKSHKYVYTWGNGRADGDGSMKPLLGGKGANLAEMTRIGLPVPPGITMPMAGNIPRPWSSRLELESL